MTKIKYVLNPGWIYSRNDNDHHYISECVISYGDARDLGKHFSNLIVLEPLYEGNYTDYHKEGTNEGYSRLHSRWST